MTIFVRISADSRSLAYMLCNLNLTGSFVLAIGNHEVCAKEIDFNYPASMIDTMFISGY